MNRSLVHLTSYKFKNFKGAILVELSLILPIFFMLIFSFIELGWILHTRLMMSIAAREGARALAIQEVTVNQAENLALHYLSDTGLSVNHFSIRGEDRDPHCSRSHGEVSMS